MVAISEESDEALLRSIQAGSHPAFAALVTRHTKRFYALAWSILRQQEAAEDVLQHAFLTLWEKPDLWKEGKGAKFTTWFYRLVFNRCLDQKRRPGFLPLPEEPMFADPDPLAEAVMLKQEESARLTRALQELPERQRAALTLCFSEGLSNQEAAQTMGLHLKALQSLLMRAKQTLKARLRGEEEA